MCERLNQTLIQALTLVTHQNPNDWDTYLPSVLFSLRGQRSQATGFSPFELIYGRNLNKPGDPYELDNWLSEINVGRYTPYARDLVERLSYSCKLAAKTSMNQKERWLKTANKNRRGQQPFTVGQKVKLRVIPSARTKFGDKWIGPFVVERKLGEVNYVISDRDGANTLVHMDRIAPWKGHGAVEGEDNFSESDRGEVESEVRHESDLDMPVDNDPEVAQDSIERERGADGSILSASLMPPENSGSLRRRVPLYKEIVGSKVTKNGQIRYRVLFNDEDGSSRWMNEQDVPDHLIREFETKQAAAEEQEHSLSLETLPRTLDVNVGEKNCRDVGTPRRDESTYLNAPERATRSGRTVTMPTKLTE
jgi:hypothetical protein